LIMLQTALREDALTSCPTGFELRVGLSWIRSMPLASVGGLKVALDGDVVPVRVVLGERAVPAEELALEPGWWFVQDRMVIAGARNLDAGAHDVTVDFTILVPYLQAGPGAPLVLPFHLEARLELDGPAVISVSRDVA
jgi:hypothetical protein